jgi:hypothetical protein
MTRGKRKRNNAAAAPDYCGARDCVRTDNFLQVGEGGAGGRQRTAEVRIVAQVELLQRGGQQRARCRKGGRRKCARQLILESVSRLQPDTAQRTGDEVKHRSQAQSTGLPPAFIAVSTSRRTRVFVFVVRLTLLSCRAMSDKGLCA